MDVSHLAGKIPGVHRTPGEGEKPPPLMNQPQQRVLFLLNMTGLCDLETNGFCIKPAKG